MAEAIPTITYLGIEILIDKTDQVPINVNLQVMCSRPRDTWPMLTPTPIMGLGAAWGDPRP